MKASRKLKQLATNPRSSESILGRMHTGTDRLSIAHMKSPEGWIEPGQTPQFDEYTIVLEGALVVKTKSQEFSVQAGNSILIEAGEWVQYSTPDSGASYIAVCLPAFSMETVHRDPE